MNITYLDTIIIVTYLLAIVIFSFILSHKEKAEEYFVNNRKTKLFLLVTTSLSTTVGAGVVMGVATTSFTTGISFGILFIAITLFGWALMSYIAPKIKQFGDRTKAYTFGDYLAHQYSERTRKVGRIVILVAYLVITAIQFIAFGQLIHTFTDIPFHTGLIIMAAITICYSFLAGLKGDFYIDAIQFFIMIPLFIFLIYKGFQLTTIEQITSLPPTYFDLYGYNGPVFFWAGILFGIPLIATSVDTWQRAFAAIDQQTARQAFYITGILKMLVLISSILIGLFAVILIPNAKPETVFLTFMHAMLPVGFLGLGIASVLAVILSTLDSCIIIGSATITKDFLITNTHSLSEEKKLQLGRIASVCFGLCGFLLAYFIRDIVILTVVSAQILLIFTPSLLGGLIWNNNNEKAAFWSIILGFIITLSMIPINPNMAFIPGLLVSCISYILIALLKKK